MARYTEGDYLGQDSTEYLVQCLLSRLSDATSYLSTLIDSDMAPTSAAVKEVTDGLRQDLDDVMQRLDLMSDEVEDARGNYSELGERLDGIDEALSGKQAVLTFDLTPIENSTNPVTSGGVYAAIAGGSKLIRELWFSPRSEFPEQGQAKILYIDTADNRMYYWSETVYVELIGSMSANIVAKTTAQWAASASTLSQLGWIYIYTDYRQEGGVDIPAIKIGDGHAYVVDLPFFSTGVTEADRTRWDNKVSARIAVSDHEKLELYTD